MKKNYIIILIFIITASITPACTHLVKKQIAENSDKNYHFTDFYYTHLDSTEEEAFNFMSKFPIKKVMYMLAKEHNINIDISEFQKFLLTEKQAGIKVKKGFRKEYFSWNNNSEVNNKIIIYYKRDYFEQKNPDFKISLVISGKSYDLMETEVHDNDHLIKRIAVYNKSSKNAAAEYERLNYQKISPVPGVIEYPLAYKLNNEESEKNSPDKADKKTEIENALRDYVKDLNKEDKAKFRHDMLDLIYKITE